MGNAKTKHDQTNLLILASWLTCYKKLEESREEKSPTGPSGLGEVRMKWKGASRDGAADTGGGYRKRGL